MTFFITGNRTIRGCIYRDSRSPSISGSRIWIVGRSSAQKGKVFTVHIYRSSHMHFALRSLNGQRCATRPKSSRGQPCAVSSARCIIQMTQHIHTQNTHVCKRSLNPRPLPNAQAVVNTTNLNKPRNLLVCARVGRTL